MQTVPCNAKSISKTVGIFRKKRTTPEEHTAGQKEKGSCLISLHKRRKDLASSRYTKRSVGGRAVKMNCNVTAKCACINC